MEFLIKTLFLVITGAHEHHKWISPLSGAHVLLVIITQSGRFQPSWYLNRVLLVHHSLNLFNLHLNYIDSVQPTKLCL